MAQEGLRSRRRVGRAGDIRDSKNDLAAGAELEAKELSRMDPFHPTERAALYFPISVALVFAALLLGGCDTVRARFRAREGVDRYQQGEFSEAATKFAEAAQLDSAMPVIQLDLGTSNLAIFRAKGSKDPAGQEAAGRAIHAYERYLELRPKDDRVRLSLQQTFVDTNRYEDAAAFFRPLVDKSPPDIQALNTMAIIAAKCGKFEEAQAWHERRIAASPESPEGYLALGVLLWEQLHEHPEYPADRRQSMVDTALKALKKAIELQPAAPNPYTYANLVYRERAASESGDTGKREALEEANRYYRLALERQNHGN
jgi:tetratricopeptide (TPR) repeat protein